MKPYLWLPAVCDDIALVYDTERYKLVMKHIIPPHEIVWFRLEIHVLRSSIN